MDPFVMANDAQFVAPGSDEAIFTPVGAQPLADPIRVIHSRPDVDTTFGEGRVIQGSNLFLIRRSEVAQPRKGDVLAIGVDRFKLQGDAMIDVEGLNWRIGATDIA